MKTLTMLVFISLALLTGCTALQPQPEIFQGIKVSGMDGDGVRVLSVKVEHATEHAAIAIIARKAFAWTDTTGMHLELKFLTSEGRLLDARSVPVTFRPRLGRGSPPLERFVIPLDQIPDGTLEIVVVPHRGAT